VLIDVHTGAATIQQSGQVSWWGAGVTTSAPLIDSRSSDGIVPAGLTSRPPLG
jgi:hypothetical protein